MARGAARRTGHWWVRCGRAIGAAGGVDIALCALEDERVAAFWGVDAPLIRAGRRRPPGCRRIPGAERQNQPMPPPADAALPTPPAAAGPASPEHKDKSAPQRAMEKLGLRRDIDLALHLPAALRGRNPHHPGAGPARRRPRPGRGGGAPLRGADPRPAPVGGPAARWQRRAGAALHPLLPQPQQGAGGGPAGAGAGGGAGRLLRAGDGSPGFQGRDGGHAPGRWPDTRLPQHRGIAAGLPAQGGGCGAEAG